MLLNILKSQAGIALDEAVLVMTMVSGFSGFVIVAKPFGGFGSASTPVAEIVSDLGKIERANYEFYRRYLNWPHETTNGEWNENINVLQSVKSMSPYYRNKASISANFLPNYETNNENNALQHKLGSGGDIVQHEIEYNGKKYLEIVLKNVPYDLALGLDKKIDGVYDPNNGRVNVIFEGERVDVHYRANKV